MGAVERCRHWAVFNITKWKSGFLPNFLGSNAQVDIIAGLDYQAITVASETTQVLLWSSDLNPELERQIAADGLSIWRAEDGFIRSVGLGADGYRPISLVIDSRGIYYDATAPSDLEHILNTNNFSTKEISRAQALRQRLVELGVSKYNVGSAQSFSLPTDKRLILVPGQVESDASIAKGSPDIKTNGALLRAVREGNPDAFVIYKPHPDVVISGRDGRLQRKDAADDLFDLEVREASIVDLLTKVDEVHTMTSLTGFEALLRGVKVTTYGLPFYAGWGLTTDRLRCGRRTRQRTLDELVAATLIAYPRYADPETGRRLTVEEAVDVLARQLAQRRRTPPGVLFFRYYRAFNRKVLRLFGVRLDP